MLLKWLPKLARVGASRQAYHKIQIASVSTSGGHSSFPGSISSRVQTFFKHVMRVS